VKKTLRVIADDLTGACDVGGEFAAAGYEVAVLVDPERADDGGSGLRVLNTQSRALDAARAHARVLAVVRRHPAEVLFKKIDTALRGHLGAELAAAVEGLGGAPAFVLPAVPAAGRVTRAGCQWFDGRPLAATEFASDPEGYGAESSICAVLARESVHPSAVVRVEDVRAGRLGSLIADLRRRGVAFFVIDVETETDVATAVAAILELAPPVCVAGSVALAQALAARADLEPGANVSSEIREPVRVLPGPALVVSGSLHSRSREQVAALEAAGIVRVVSVSPRDGGAATTLVARVRAWLATGDNVALVPPPPELSPHASARRAMEQLLGDVVARVVTGGGIASLVLIGGETSYEILRVLGAREIVVRGRPASLLAVGRIAAGTAAGAMLLTKGGSGGAPDALVPLLAEAGAARSPTTPAAGRG
jgi:D-threonate/D-erythronate kinase